MDNKCCSVIILACLVHRALNRDGVSALLNYEGGGNSLMNLIWSGSTTHILQNLIYLLISALEQTLASNVLVKYIETDRNSKF